MLSGEALSRMERMMTRAANENGRSVFLGRSMSPLASGALLLRTIMAMFGA